MRRALVQLLQQYLDELSRTSTLIDDIKHLEQAYYTFSHLKSQCINRTVQRLGLSDNWADSPLVWRTTHHLDRILPGEAADFKTKNAAALEMQHINEAKDLLLQLARQRAHQRDP